MTLDSLISSMAPRILLVKQSVSSLIDSYISLREFIRSIRGKVAENKDSETSVSDAAEEKRQAK